MQDEHNNEPPQNEDVFVANPDEDYYEDEYLPELPGWTKPVGILSIVFGSISLVCTGLGTASMAFLQPWGYSMMEEQFGPAPSVMTTVPVQIYIVFALTFVLQVLLIMAGAAALSRKIATRAMHLLYAVLMIVATVWSTLANMQWQQANADWAQQNPDSDWAQQITQQQSFSAIGIVIGVLLSVAWPTFCLIWFGLVKKTEHDLTGGVDPAA